MHGFYKQRVQWKWLLIFYRSSKQDLDACYTVKSLYMSCFFCSTATLTPCPPLAPYQLETDHTTDTLNFMVYVKVSAACPESSFHKPFIGSVLGVINRHRSCRLWCCFFFYTFFVTGHFQSVSSTTGHTQLIHFLRTTPLPNGVAAPRGPVHNAVMTPRVKGRLASSSIKAERLQLHDSSFLWQEGASSDRYIQNILI